MIIGVEAYEVLRSHVEHCVKNDTAVTVEDAMKFGVPFDCLSSLFSQISLRLGNQYSSLSDEMVRKVDLREESLWSLSRQSSKGCYTIAKNYLELKFGKDFKIATFLEDPSIVVVPEIRHDLLRMIVEDFNNSVEANLIKESTGKDYEDILIDLLHSRKMCFETEEESRAKGKPKTPDVLFLIPMATTKGRYDPSEYYLSTTGAMSTNNQLRRSSPTKKSSNAVQSISFQSDDYLVINWIDSKAMFADKKTFQDHLIQLESYRNRYGRGMVIYWHGVVDEVYSLLSDDMIVVRDSFPDDWIFPTGEPADGRTPIFDTDKDFATSNQEFDKISNFG